MSEELTIEERKKAINLQDLVYVKKYIDDRHYSKAETEAAIDAAKEELNADIAEAIEASTKSYTKGESDDLFYKKTDTVANATDATYALYASADTSKGTIEERLTNMGFEQGSASLSGSGLGTVSKNVLTRVSKYVFVDIEFQVGPSTTNFDSISISIPAPFRPKSNIKMLMVHEVSAWFEDSTLQSYASIGYYNKNRTRGSYSVTGLNINTNGTTSINKSSAPYGVDICYGFQTNVRNGSFYAYEKVTPNGTVILRGFYEAEKA